jgi:hypothetical protein
MGRSKDDREFAWRAAGWDVAHARGAWRGGSCMFLVGVLIKVQKDSKHGEGLLSRYCSRPFGHSDYSSIGWFQTGTCPSGRTRGDSDSSRVPSEGQSCNWTSR